MLEIASAVRWDCTQYVLHQEQLTHVSCMMQLHDCMLALHALQLRAFVQTTTELYTQLLLLTSKERTCKTSEGQQVSA